MYRPSSNWNGHRPLARTTGAHRALAAEAPKGAARPYTYRFEPNELASVRVPLPDWLPDVD